MHLTNLEQEIINQIKKHEKDFGYKPTMEEIAEVRKCSRSNINAVFKSLIQKGKLEKKGGITFSRTYFLK